MKRFSSTSSGKRGQRYAAMENGSRTTAAYASWRIAPRALDSAARSRLSGRYVNAAHRSTRQPAHLQVAVLAGALEESEILLAQLAQLRANLLEHPPKRNAIDRAAE